jgi:CBS domain containing-hemolysin-like protein
MTALFVLAGIVLALVAALASLLQLLYLESLRLRTREYRSLEFFKSTLQERLGLKIEDGAARFSLLKHTCLALSGVIFFLAAATPGAPVWQAALTAALLSWATMLVATYLIPQILYRRSSLSWVTPAVPVGKALALAMLPFNWFVNFVYSLVELGTPEKGTEQVPDMAEHIEALISAGEEEGIIEEEDRRLIQSVVAFGDKTVREVMTPRPNIVAIEVGRSLDDLRRLVINEQYSRIPVYEGSIDQVIGFVHVRDMFELDAAQHQTRTVRDLMRPLRLVPETKPVNDLLREMQHDGAHMAIVVDEYGNTAGLVTMEDMVEVIVGEIHDEHEPERDINEQPDGSYIVSGSFDVDRLQGLLKFRPAEHAESTTVGGLVTEWLGRVPSAGEAVERDGIRIEVLASNELRVEQVRVARAPAVPSTAEKVEKT